MKRDTTQQWFGFRGVDFLPVPLRTVIIKRPSVLGNSRQIKITAHDISDANIARILEHVRKVEAGELKTPRRARIDKGGVR